MRGVVVVARYRRLVPAQVDEIDGRLWRTVGRLGPPFHIVRFTVSPTVPQLWTSPW